MTRWRQIVRLVRWLRRERHLCRVRPIHEVSTDQPDPAAAVRWLGELTIGGAPRHALFSHPTTSLVYRLRARPGDDFVTSCALLPDAWDRNRGGVEFAVEITGGSGARAAATLRVNPGRRWRDRRWRPLRVRLPVPREEEIAVTLSTRVPPGGRADYAWAVWGEPAVERPRPRDEIRGLLRAAVADLRRRGITAALKALSAAALVDEHTAMYQRWHARHAPSPDDVARMAAEAARLPCRPLISILTPVYNTDPACLRACIDSVMRQAYVNWELCLSDDGSTRQETVAVLRAQTDPRIRVATAGRNAGISAASNAALALASGEFVALLDHDDELTPDALYEVVRYLNEHPDADVLYSDEDKRDADGGLSEPFFKPDWSPEHLLSAAYTCHLTVARKALVDRLGGFRTGYEGAQDHDLTLRLSGQTSSMHHLPKVLYHWRRTPESTATAGSAKTWAHDAGRLALEDHARRNLWNAEVLSGGVPGLYRVKFAIDGEPRVLIVVVAQNGGRSDADACVRAVRAKTPYSRYDVTIASGAGAALTAQINELIRRRPGAHVVLLDALVDPLDDEWLSALLEYSQQNAIGGVGGRIEYHDGRLRHIGVVTSNAGGPARPFDGHAGNSYGHFSSAIGVRNYSAVSGESLMTRRDVFERLGGFDARLPWTVADVDYCLRARQAGLRIVFTPYARLRLRGTSAPRPADTAAVGALGEAWGPALETDPYYNSNLSRRSADCLLDEVDR